MYEIVSDMSTRQDALEDRIAGFEEKLVALQEQIELLPELIATRIAAQVILKKNLLTMNFLETTIFRMKNSNSVEISYIQNQQLLDYSKQEVYHQRVRGRHYLQFLQLNLHLGWSFQRPVQYKNLIN